MIKLQDVSGGYDGRQFLKHISFEIPKGTVTAIVGPNGCGKSTLLRMMAGLHPVYEGEIRVNEKKIGAYKEKELARMESFFPQTRDVPNIRVESLVLHGRFPYMGYPRRYGEEDRKKAREALAWAGVEELAERMVPTLSGGERQKVYIAMLLAQETPIVLMDEPTSYLDIARKFEIMRLAKRMQKEGKTVVLVLHDLDLALRWADRLIVMREGKVCREGTPEELYESGILEEVFHVRVRRMKTEDGTYYVFGETD